MTARFKFVLAAGIALALGSAAFAQQAHQHGQGMMGRGMMGQPGHMMGGGVMRGMLHGPGSTEAETAELATMFHNHGAITRSVTNLPDGIDTLTESRDPALRASLVSHVAGMITRIEEGRDPQVPIQSPTLDTLFQNRALIETVLEPTDHGIRVIQTSDDRATVSALQTHAAEVSDMVARGMMAVHAATMGN